MNRENKILSLIAEFRQLGIDKQIDYEKFYLYSLITHSTAIEGSTITEIENQLLFDEGIAAKGHSMAEQLMNIDLKNAYEHTLQLAKKHTPITIDSLKKQASIVMKNTGTVYNTQLGTFSSAEGERRLLNVTAGVGGKSYMNFASVPAKLEEFCRSLNQIRKEIAPNDIIAAYYLSFDAHFRLVTIHPWADGNGRMSRLVMNQLQFEFNIIPTKIDKDNKAKYIETLVATRESDNLQLFRDFMLDEHIRNLELTISQYKDSLSKDDVPVNVPVNVPVKLTGREGAIINLMQGNPSVTIHEISLALGVTEKTIKRDIVSMRNKSLITRVGSDKRGEWVVL